MITATLNNGTSKYYTFTKEELQAFTKPMIEGSHHALNYFFSLTGLMLPDYSQILKKLVIPVKVVWGECDDILVWQNQASRVMADLKLDEKDVTVLSRLKHFIQEENPNEIAQAILSLM